MNPNAVESATRKSNSKPFSFNLEIKASGLAPTKKGALWAPFKTSELYVI